MRVEKSGETEIGLDDDTTILRTTAAGIRMLCFYGRREEVERAQEIAIILEKWLEKIQSPSESTISADDNPNDLKNEQRQPRHPVPSEALAAAHRSLGVCRAHWARLTYDISSRPELQAKAITSFRAALVPALADREQGETFYDLAMILAETRDIDAATDSVKMAISLCTNDAGEEPLEDRTGDDSSTNGEGRRVLFKAWHLLAFLLSARQDFTTAIASGDAAYELYGDLIEYSKHHKPTERLALSEREYILELKMTQLVLSQILDGPSEAVNGSGELLGLYKELFEYGEGSKADPSSTATSTVRDKKSPLQSANGTARSSRRSILGRSKDAVVASLPRVGHHSTHGLNGNDGSTETAQDPVISVTHDGPIIERKYQPPHHLARQESKKLHKRQSRKSMASDRHSRGVSPNKSSLPNGVDGAAQALPLRVARIQRSSLEVSSNGSSAGDGAASSDEVGFAVVHNAPSTRETGSSGSTGPQGLPPSTAQSTHHKNQNISPKYPKPPPSASSEPSPISSFSMHSLPDPIYPSSDLKRHALTLLTRIWLLIAQLYREAAMPVDAQGALSEAFSQAQGIEALVATTESSAQALSTPGWANVRSVSEVWADVHAEQAALHLQLGSREKASEEFGKAIVWFPDHNAATVGLSNMLLEHYSQKPSATKAIADPLAESPTSQPTLATLPGSMPLKTDFDQDSGFEDEGSATLLSRLAARDRAYGLLSMLTKSGRGWDDSEAWYALAQAYEESGQIDKAKEALWWVVELEEGRPIRDWHCIGGF